MEVFLARQPIFDGDLDVYGYELLYRSCRTSAFDGADGDLASLQVLANTLLTFGPARILAGKVAFINFTRGLLVNEHPLLLPAETLVIEVLESVEVDDKVITACRNLVGRGYRVALDDFVPNKHSQQLIEFASIVKVDFRATSERERRQMVRRYGRAGVQMLAEKVETEEEFARARREGFSYFQGYFFARPVILARKDIPPFKVNLFRILAEVHDPRFDFGRVDQLIRQDMALCYRLLRYVNSAAFGWHSDIASIHQAIVLLGEQGMRKWLTLASLPVLASDKPDELVATAMQRARFCELVASCVGLSGRRSELFLMGMFSLLDAMVGRPLDELLGELGLAGDIRDALLGISCEENPLAQVYRLVLSCERAEWDVVATMANRLGIPSEMLSDLHINAASWRLPCSGVANSIPEREAAQLERRPGGVRRC